MVNQDEWDRDVRKLLAAEASVRFVSAEPMLGPIPWVESAHPSPLSASRGFFGSRPFSRVNTLLTEQGGRAVDWSIPAPLASS